MEFLFYLIGLTSEEAHLRRINLIFINYQTYNMYMCMRSDE